MSKRFRRPNVAEMDFEQGIAYFTRILPELATMEHGQQQIDRLNSYRG